MQFHQIGGPEVLSLEEISNQVAKKSVTGNKNRKEVRVLLAGVNFIDVYHRRGQYGLPLPSGIGIEGIGETADGDRVFWLSSLGSYSQYIDIDEEALTQLPRSSLTDEQILPLLCQGMTAHYLVDSAHSAKAGEVALVTAAAGGVGLLLIQLLKAKGVTVLAFASSVERAELARKHGADLVGTYSELNRIVGESRQNSGVDGVNVVYDSVGKDYFDLCLDSLAPAGMYVLYGGASGPVPPFDLMRLNSKSLAIRRPTLATYTATSTERIRRLTELISLAERGQLVYPEAKIFPLSQASQAHALIESRTYSGKIALDPWKI